MYFDFTQDAKDLAAVARDKRKSLGWSQTELAEKVGVNRYWVTDFEKGKSTVALRFVLKTMAVLGFHIFLEEDRPKGDIDLDALLDGSLDDDDDL